MMAGGAHLRLTLIIINRTIDALKGSACSYTALMVFTKSKEHQVVFRRFAGRYRFFFAVW